MDKLKERVQHGAIFLLGFIAALGGFFALHALAFSEPSGTPPSGSPTSAPLNTGSSAQVKGTGSGSAWITADGFASLDGALFNGRVGIDNDSPSQALDVGGYVNAEDGYCIAGNCITNWPSSSLWGVTGSSVYYNGGNVGVGTANPAAKLDVEGGGMILGTAAAGTNSNTKTLTILTQGSSQDDFGSYPGSWTNALQIQSNDGSRYVWLSPLDTNSSANARLVTSGTGLDIDPGNVLAASFTTAGNVGIGTTNPSQKLDVSGNVNAAGYCISGSNCITSWPTGASGTITGPYLPSYASWASSGTGGGGAAIYNDNAGYDSLMIVGNSSSGQDGDLRQVHVYDDLTVNNNITAQNNLAVDGSANVSGSLTAGSLVANNNLYVSGLRYTSESNIYLDAVSSTNTTGGISLLRNDGNRWGYFYADNSGIGILNGAGGWGIQVGGGPNAVDNAVNIYANSVAVGTFNSSGLTVGSGEVNAGQFCLPGGCISAWPTSPLTQQSGYVSTSGGVLTGNSASGNIWLPYTDGNSYLRSPINYVTNTIEAENGNWSINNSGQASFATYVNSPSVYANQYCIGSSCITSWPAASSWSLNGSDLSYNGGYVGIGITNPATKLDVQGTVNATSGYISDGDIGGTAEAAYLPQGLYAAGSNNWLYGTTYINSTMYDANNTGYYFLPSGTSNLNILTIGTSVTTPNLYATEVYANDWFRVNGTGDGIYWSNYGIGLYAQDSSWIRTYNGAGLWANTSTIATNGSISSGYGGAPGPSGGAIFAGNVGIGTQSPTQKLDVAGNVNAQGYCIGSSCITSWPAAQSGYTGTITDFDGGASNPDSVGSYNGCDSSEVILTYVNGVVTSVQQNNADNSTCPNDSGTDG